MKTLYGLVLALALGLAAALLWPSGARGTAAGPPDVIDWALPDATVAVVFRGADTLPKRLAVIGERFAGAERLTRDIAAVRALDMGGLQPGGDLLAGMDPARGLAIFADASGRSRLVVGARDAKRLRQSMAALLGLLDVQVTATDEGFGGPMPLPCVEADGLMICDSAGPPKAPPGRPDDLGTDTWLTIRVSGAALAELPPSMGSAVSSARLDVKADDARVTARASATIKPEMLPMYAQARAVLRPTAGASATDAMHPRTPYMFKVSLDAAKLAEVGGQGLTPPLDGQVKAVVQHWTGELALSFVGGLAEPVLSLGLGEGSQGADLLDALLALLPPDVPRPQRTAEALVFRTEPDPDMGDVPLVVTLPYRTVGGHLLLGLDPLDLQRVERERAPPPNLPPSLSARGAHGAFLAHLPLAAATGAGEFMRVELPKGRQWPALLSWLQAEAYLMDGIWWTLLPGEDTMAVELGWSRL